MSKNRDALASKKSGVLIPYLGVLIPVWVPAPTPRSSCEDGPRGRGGADGDGGGGLGDMEDIEQTSNEAMEGRHPRLEAVRRLILLYRDPRNTFKCHNSFIKYLFPTRK